MSQIPSSDREQAMWCSYMPALGFALARSSGPVLEIGIGHFSTPFLHEYCKGAGRDLVSHETDLKWFEDFLGRYQSGSHEFWYPDYPHAKYHGKWGVVFIDNSPGGEARLRPFLEFLDHADYLVVHDYHRENEEAIRPFLGGVNHRVFDAYQPPTLLASRRCLVN